MDQCHVQGALSQVAGLVRGPCPSDDASAAHNAHGGEIQPAFARGDVRDVAHPHAIESRAGKRPSQAIGGCRDTLVGSTSAQEAPASKRHHAMPPSQARNTVSTARLAALDQHTPEATRAICLPLSSEEHTYELQSPMRISYAVFRL